MAIFQGVQKLLLPQGPAAVQGQQGQCLQGSTALVLVLWEGTGTDAVLVTNLAWQLDFPQSRIS